MYRLICLIVFSIVVLFVNSPITLGLLVLFFFLTTKNNNDFTDTESDPMFLRLFLNSLHLLCADKKPALMVKAIFELRIAVLSGYAPDLVACADCGAFETPQMEFDPLNGVLYCDNCAKSSSLLVDLGVISAMRHIVFADFSELFRFRLDDSLLPVLNRLTERYLEHCFGHRFRLLDFLYQTSN